MVLGYHERYNGNESYEKTEVLINKNGYTDTMTDDSGLSVSGPQSYRAAAIMLVVGLGIAGYGAYDYVQQSQAVSDAVEVDAEVVSTSVESVSVSSSPGADYKPTVEFTYEYEGTSYTSTNVFPAEISQTYDTESAARDVVGEYEQGTTVTAYVDPGDPNGAFLKNSPSNTPLIFVGIGLVFAVVGGRSVLGSS